MEGLVSLTGIKVTLRGSLATPIIHWYLTPFEVITPYKLVIYYLLLTYIKVIIYTNISLKKSTNCSVYYWRGCAR